MNVYVCMYTVRHKKCILLISTITLKNYAILWSFLAYRCTREYHIASLFDRICKIENWEPAYQICYCLFSSRQQSKMWNMLQRETQTSSLQTYVFPTVLTLIQWIAGYGKYCRNVYWKSVKTERWWMKVASDWSVVWHPAKCLWSGDWPMASFP